ncbi:MAG: SDR family oxidoreductase [bacterium]
MVSDDLSNRPRILVTGASGQLGHYILRCLESHGKKVCGWSQKSTGTLYGTELRCVDFTRAESVVQALESARPDVIIHAGAMSGADDVRKDPQRGHIINTEATRLIADWADAHEARLIYTSTDMVFDGSRPMWREEDKVCPILAYGLSKAAAEPFVTSLKHGLVVRISLLFGPTLTGRPSFFTSTLNAIAVGESRTVFIDEWRTPVDYQTTAKLLCTLALDHAEITGILHLGGPERMTRYELIRRAAHSAGLDTSLVLPVRASDLVLPETRPRDLSLETRRLQSLLADVSWACQWQSLTQFRP